jgi:hypothetical protein
LQSHRVENPHVSTAMRDNVRVVQQAHCARNALARRGQLTRDLGLG